ncbi:hypothetical protein EJF36_11975 [Bacillus sp. HMF5848]|uniref:hypothetical protein n=1 Tax=Bacillus sp. HMF5848 TaxID=2495421 RepID=UPI000F76F2C0|nr:hypothetical protein [Bacillus sp. HMF5848]RSK27537.1 hypothetical protein EJF36_11975 [Bacillus sp. HMF5848]
MMQYEQQIQNLKQQIEYLQGYIHYINQYIHYSHVYEYYIKKVKIGNVSGVFQLGQLSEYITIDREGIHRFYIDDITIRNITEKGKVGVGLTEVGQFEEVEDEENNEIVKEIFENVKLLLALDEVPSFFQALQKKEDVLVIVWDLIEERWNNSQIFNQFYEKVLYVLNKAILPDIQQNSNSLSYELSIELADNIEQQAKTLLVLVQLMEDFLPSYTQKYNISLSTPKQEYPETIKQIRNAIKDILVLPELPDTYKELESDHPDILRSVYYKSIKPLSEGEYFKTYFQEIYGLINKEKYVSNNTDPIGISPEKQTFLFSTLIHFFNKCQKDILLEYILLQEYKNNVS